MPNQTILVVDDEKNIRFALDQALRPLGFRIVSAADGASALAQLEAERPAVLVLDLKLPDMDGMEVLRQTAHLYPEVRVIVITAHGSVDNAVDAMKLGAIDFLEKPFSIEEIRELVTSVLDREQLDAGKAASYDDHVQLARRFITDRHFDAATEHVRMAIADDPSRPEAFNLLGVLREIDGDRDEALTNYRVALEVGPAYKPAKHNLARASRRIPFLRPRL
jgi:DNA-binding NtrC family response regulator